MVGGDHALALGLLLDAYEDTRRQWLPRMVSLTAETGVGKTRVVQEFYRRVAATDPYWPPVLRAPNQRKAVVPLKSDWSGEPMLLWLGLSCWQQPDGRPAVVLDSALPRQLAAHARGLLAREHRTAAAKEALVQTASAIAPLLGVQALRAVIDALGKAREVREIVRSLESAAGRVEEDADERVVEAVLSLANLTNTYGMSMVVVVDDAHDADSTTLAAIERLLESGRGVLVIATSWPTALERQRTNAEGFGHWLDRAAPTHRIARRELQLLPPVELAKLAENAARERQRDEVDRDAAQLVAERASGNPMLLANLLELVWVNGLALRAQDLPDLVQLPSEPNVIFREVWTRFLPAEARRTLQVAGLLGTPIHEILLRSAARAAGVRDRGAIAQTLALGWLAAIPDPYTDERRIRFSEPFLREVAESYTGELAESVRDRIIEIAVTCALVLPTRTSNYARTEALELAVKFIEREPSLRLFTVDVFSELADLLWRSDPARAAKLLDQAVRVQLADGEQPSNGLLMSAAVARAKIGEVDEAFKIFDLGGPALLAMKASRALIAERWAETVDTAREALTVEIATPGTVLWDPYRAEKSVILSLASDAGGAGLLSDNQEIRAAAVSVLEQAMRGLLDQGRRAEARGVAWHALACDQSKVAPLLDELGLSADEEHELDEAELIDAARRSLEEGKIPDLADALAQVVTYRECVRALPLAQSLVERGGPDHAPLLSFVALGAGEFALAAETSRLVLANAKRKRRPPDAPELQVERRQLAQALAAAGHGEQAARVADLSLEIAERARVPGDITAALIVRAYAHLALAEYEQADEKLTTAEQNLTDEHVVRHLQYPDERISRTRCDLFGLQADWTALRRVLQAVSESTFSPLFRSGWRMMAWRDLARWLEDRVSFERELLTGAGLGALLDQDAIWAHNTLERAMDHLYAGLRELGQTPLPVVWSDVGQWLTFTLRDAGHTDDVTRLAALIGSTDA